MVKRGVVLKLSLCLVFCFAFSYVFAQEGAEDLTVKLRDARSKRAGITNNYNKELEEINKTCDDRLCQIKADFHKARAECLKEKEEKSEQLRETYKNEITPIMEEERQIVEKMGTGEGMNFAKPKATRTK